MTLAESFILTLIVTTLLNCFLRNALVIAVIAGVLIGGGYWAYYIHRIGYYHPTVNEFGFSVGLATFLEALLILLIWRGGRKLMARIKWSRVE